MKRTCAGLAAALALIVVELHAPQTAEACSVKLITKAPTPRRAVTRSSRPSDILVVGEASPRLRRDLTAKGHNVETVPDASSVKHKKYAAVITDEQHASEARAKFGNEVVIVRSSDIGNVVRGVETVVARVPSNTDKNRVTLATPKRTPIAAGRGEKPASPPIAAKPRPAPEPARTPTPEKTVTASVRPVEETRRAPEKAVAPATLREEIYFGVGSANISRKAAVARAVKWLDANASGSILIEGHADPTGTPEGNQALSQSRADAVKDAIVSEGADGSRIEVQAYGDTKLKYGRSDARNRRVSIQAKP